MKKEIMTAKSNEIEEVLNVLWGRVEWFKKNKIEQWDREYIDTKRIEVAKCIQDENCYVLKIENRIVAICILMPRCDKWKDDKSAKYIYLLASEIGGGGKLLLDYIVQKCKLWGVEFLRLDCQDQNVKLKYYYLRYGFKQVSRTPHKYFADRYSSLFELRI